MIAFLVGFVLGILSLIAAGVVFWKRKGLKFVCVENRQQAVEIVVWPGEWAIGCARHYKDWTV